MPLMDVNVDSKADNELLVNRMIFKRNLLYNALRDTYSNCRNIRPMLILI